MSQCVHVVITLPFSHERYIGKFFLSPAWTYLHIFAKKFSCGYVELLVLLNMEYESWSLKWNGNLFYKNDEHKEKHTHRKSDGHPSCNCRTSNIFMCKTNEPLNSRILPQLFTWHSLNMARGYRSKRVQKLSGFPWRVAVSCFRFNHLYISPVCQVPERSNSR